MKSTVKSVASFVSLNVSTAKYLHVYRMSSLFILLLHQMVTVRKATVCYSVALLLLNYVLTFHLVVKLQHKVTKVYPFPIRGTIQNLDLISHELNSLSIQFLQSNQLPET